MRGRMFEETYLSELELCIVQFSMPGSIMSRLPWVIFREAGQMRQVLFCGLLNCCCCSVTKSCKTFWMPSAVACQASLSFTISQSLLRLKYIELVMSIIFCRPLLLLLSIFPPIRIFSKSQLFPLGGQNVAASAPASVLPINNHG